MKIFTWCFVLCLLSFAIVACDTGKSHVHVIESPDNSVQVSIVIDQEGRACYSVKKSGEDVLLSSSLGIRMQDADFTGGLKFSTVSDVKNVSDRYRMQTGKRREISYRANERVFSLSNADNKNLEVIFRVSDDGVAFRYRFPGESKDVKKVTEERTSFAFPHGAKAWLQPMQVAQIGWKNTNPAYEEHYQMAIDTGTPSPDEAGWVFPALFESNGTWLLISETAMDGNYHASRLQQHSPGGEYRLGFPMADEVYIYEGRKGALKPESTLPFVSPWRIIALGSLATIVESTLGTDLAEPAIDIDTSFIQPGQASWSWAILKDDSILYDIQKRFIDYAADMQWEYTLIDVNWDSRIGYDRVKELADYAAAKNVGVLLWYNSSGDWNQTDYQPKSRLLTHEARVKEFGRLREMGIKGVKVDFFAGDGKSMMQYYIDIMQDAADHQLLVNFHGSTIPRGWQRTYPNLMTMESIRGFEFITFFQETADLEASHSTMLPFTRNAFDPMDFTPTVFDNIPDRVRKTSNGFQIALPVLFLSGIQHIAETPEGMATVPEYVKAFMRRLPNQWDDVRFIDGYPGRLAVIARRAGNAWYIAGINGQDQTKKLSLDLSFIAGQNGYMITDGDAPFSFSRKKLTAENQTKLSLGGNSGFVMVFE